MKRTHLEYSFCRNKAIVYKSVNEAWPKAQRMGIEIDALEREAELSFVLAYHSWKERGLSGSFPGFLKTCVSNRLRNFLRNEYRRTIKADSLDIVYTCKLPWEGPGPAADIEYQETVAELSEDARIIISALLHAPEELLADVKNTESIKLVRGALKRWLRKQGWERKRINTTFNELGRAFG